MINQQKIKKIYNNNLNFPYINLIKILTYHLCLQQIQIIDSLGEYIGGGESPTFTTSNSEEESKIKFYFLLRHYHNDEKLLFYYRTDGYSSTCHIPLLREIVIIKEPLICAPRCAYQRIVIPPGKVLISIELNVYLKIYNKGIHNNIKTGELIILINEKDIDNILALCKKERMIQNLNITNVLSKCLKE